MFLNAFRIRLALMGAGTLVVALYLLAGGSLTPGSKPVIQIEFGMVRDELLGAEVLIDGAPAGTLQLFGNATRSGFAVSEGEHVVTVRHPELECRPARITARGSLGPALLIADLNEVSTGGRRRTVITLGH